MAFASPHIVPDKPMVPVDTVEGLSGQERSCDDLKLFKIFAATNGSPDVFLKLFGINRGMHHIPSFLNISSASSQMTRSRPESVESSVLLVVDVGMTISTGSRPRSSTCL